MGIALNGLYKRKDTQSEMSRLRSLCWILFLGLVLCCCKSSEECNTCLVTWKYSFSSVCLGVANLEGLGVRKANLERT